MDFWTTGFARACVLCACVSPHFLSSSSLKKEIHFAMGKVLNFRRTREGCNAVSDTISAQKVGTMFGAVSTQTCAGQARRARNPVMHSGVLANFSKENFLEFPSGTQLPELFFS